MNIQDALIAAINNCKPRNQHDYGSPDVETVLTKMLEAIGPAKIPEGWKLVPVELTPEMRFAFNESNKNATSWPDKQWRAMLDAAPECDIRK